MARPTMDQLRNIGNVTQKFRWNLIFAAFPTALQGPPQSDDLNLRCESSGLPKMTGSKTTVNIRGHKVFQPGIYTYSDTIALTFLETVDNVMANFLKNWRELCWATNTGITLPKNQIEATILLQRLDQQDNPIWQYTLIGAWPIDPDPGGNMEQESADPFKPVLNLAYDRFEDQSLITG